MKEKKISIIIPVYNGEMWLGRCLDSLMRQTIFPDMEIIIVDDGSQDGSWEQIAQYAQHSSQIVALRVPNGGVSKARNTGMEQARGEFVGFVDADDWVAPDFYERLYSAATAEHADIVSMGFVVVEADARHGMDCPTAAEYSVLGQKDALCRYLDGGMDIHVWTKIFRRTESAAFRFDDTLAIAEDRMFVFRQIIQAERVVLLPQCGYYYFQNENSAVHQAFSAKEFGDTEVSRRILDTIRDRFPELYPQAQCMDISAKCRILGKLAASGQKNAYRDQYQQLKRAINAYPLRSAWKLMGRKHFLVLVLTKFSPRIAGMARKNPWLRYRK